MIKTKNDNNEMVTKGMFRKGIEDLAILINKSFVGVESRMAKQEDLLALSGRTDGLVSQMDELTARIDHLETGLDKFESNVDGRFNRLLLELKDIRKEINNNEINTREDINKPDVRVAKLEKKAKV